MKTKNVLLMSLLGFFFSLSAEAQWPFESRQPVIKNRCEPGEKYACETQEPMAKKVSPPPAKVKKVKKQKTAAIKKTKPTHKSKSLTAKAQAKPKKKAQAKAAQKDKSKPMLFQSQGAPKVKAEKKEEVKTQTTAAEPKKTQFKQEEPAPVIQQITIDGEGDVEESVESKGDVSGSADEGLAAKPNESVAYQEHSQKDDSVFGQDRFRLQAKFSLGLGMTPKPGDFYLSTKFSPLHYGPSQKEGVDILNMGLAHRDGQVQFVFSPINLSQGRFGLSYDFLPRVQGISFNYSF